MRDAAKGFDALLTAIRGRRILVIGDIMLDHYMMGDATRISPEAPVPVVHVLRESDTVGGAANVAANIASLGGAAEVIGGIGGDANGEKLRERLGLLGIAFDPRFIMERRRTITKTRVIVRNQQLCRLDFEDNAADYRPLLSSDSPRWSAIDGKVAACDGVILSDYGKGILTTPTIDGLIACARRHGKFVAADPKPSSGNLYRGLDLLTPNLKEAWALSGLHPDAEGTREPGRLCAAIREKLSPRDLVVTMGADGMAISGGADSAVRQIPTAARQVYDVSGAGDTVIATLALALTSGADLVTAAHFANAAAGVVVGKLGTATVSPEELRAFAQG